MAKARISLTLCVLLLSGCAEYMAFRSHPPGALVTVTDLDEHQQSCTTPCELKISRGNVRSNFYRYRAELKGYRPEEGDIHTRVAPGRIVGIVLTAGLTAVLRGPSYFADNDIRLKPIKPTGTTGTGDTAERLRKVDKLYDEGAITEREHRRLRAEVLDEM